MRYLVVVLEDQTNIDVYDNNLTKINCSATLSYDTDSSLASMAATHVGNYAIIPSASTKAIDYSLSTIILGCTLSVATKHSCTQVGNYAIFSDAAVYAISDDLTFLRIPIDRSQKETTATHVGNYAIFSVTDSTSVEIIDNKLTYTVEYSSVSSLAFKERKKNHAATHVGNYAIFAGGVCKDKMSTTTEVYTSIE